MKKKLVVVGFGGMGAGFHVKNALVSDAVELCGVYDTDTEKQKKALEQGLKVYNTLDEVIADKDVEIVTVAIPNDAHCKTVLSCLEGGKNVICEKPAAMNSGELSEMISAAELAGKIFSVHQNRRWDVDYLAVKQICESGSIGDIFDIESRIHGSRGIPSDWRCEKSRGGGMIFDWGVHLIDQILTVIPSRIVSVYCETEHITVKDVDDGFKLHLRFENGCRAMIEVGTYNFISMPRFFVRGTKGSALIRDWRENAQVVECTHWHENDVLPVKTAAGLTKTMAPRDSLTTRAYEWERPYSDVHDYYRNFVRAVDGVEEQIVTHAQMMRVMTVMEAARSSGEEQKVLPFDDVYFAD